MRAGEKFRVDYLKIDRSMKRNLAGMSSIENADVTLRVPSVVAELAGEDFLVCSCLFQFRCFYKKIRFIIFRFDLSELAAI